MIDLMLRRAAEAGIPLTQEQAAKFETYHKLLVAANAQFNLTRVPEDIDEAIDRNYLDCISPLACAAQQKIDHASSSSGR